MTSQRFRFFRCAAALFVASASLAFSQSPADPPSPALKASLLSAPTKPIEFDVATFRLSKPGNTDRKLGFTGDAFAMQNRPFHDLIRFAFAKGRGGAYRISGPSWVDQDLYDIQAKVAPEDIAEWQKLNGVGQKIALQGFLIEYLKLKFHQDPTPYPFYALVVDKNGLKMPLYKPGDSFKTPDGQTLSTKGVLVWVSGSEMIGLDCTTERLVDQLSGHADRGVIDQTGLMPKGYSFTLQFDDAPDGTSFQAMHPEDATASIRVAIKQLGLELKSTTGPIDSMVIDHIERPPDN
jgi:bla regulator protein blaR1